MPVVTATYGQVALNEAVAVAVVAVVVLMPDRVGLITAAQQATHPTLILGMVAAVAVVPVRAVMVAQRARQLMTIAAAVAVQRDMQADQMAGLVFTTREARQRALRTPQAQRFDL